MACYFIAMHLAYPHYYSSKEAGVWWGVQIPESLYMDIIRQMHQIRRCFVNITNLRGDTMAIAIDGPHSDGDDIVFMPDWAMSRLGLANGNDVNIEFIIDIIPKAESITLRPVSESSTESPIFIDGLTEALNKLGIIQPGIVSLIIDPSLPEPHEFIIEELIPAAICLADGELRVNLEQALVTREVYSEPIGRPGTPIPPELNSLESFTDFASMLPTSMLQAPKVGFIPFSGKGRKLKDN